jgi:hypothetical protein
MEIRLIGTGEECAALLAALNTHYEVTRIRDRPAYRSTPNCAVRRVYAGVYSRKDS